ncbi:MAG: putative rane protein [Herbinix sp.]|nr:putative rane protein [Herbinix sp.]
MRINFKKEYVIISGLLLVIVFFSDFLRIIIGLPLALFLPGYLLMAILFPRKDELGGLARIALSIGLSIIIVPLIGLVLNYLSWGVKLLPMMLSLIFLDILLIFLSWYRRTKLPGEQRFVLTYNIDFIKWPDKTKGTKVIHTALLITVFLLIFTSVFILSSPKTGKNFTEFYITGLNDVTAGYPKQLQAGENGTVKAVIINNEQQKTRYRMEVWVDGDIIQTILPIYLENQEKQEITVIFKAEKPEDLAKVEFLLFRDGQDMKPYRQLRLWVEILPDLVQGSQ